MDIPITFEHKGEKYRGHLSEVKGSGEVTVWHLMVNGYYLGRLRLIGGKWFFDSNSHPDMGEKAEEFGEYVMAWYG